MATLFLYLLRLNFTIHSLYYKHLSELMRVANTALLPIKMDS